MNDEDIWMAVAIAIVGVMVGVLAWLGILGAGL